MFRKLLTTGSLGVMKRLATSFEGYLGNFASMVRVISSSEVDDDALMKTACEVSYPNVNRMLFV